MRLAGLLALSLSLLVVPSAEQTADACGVKMTVKSPGPRKAIARTANASNILIIGAPPPRLQRDLAAAGHHVDVAANPGAAKKETYAIVIVPSGSEADSARNKFPGAVVMVRSSDVASDLRTVENRVARGPVATGDRTLVAVAPKRQPTAAGPEAKAPIGRKDTEVGGVAIKTTPKVEAKVEAKVTPPPPKDETKVAVVEQPKTTVETKVTPPPEEKTVAVTTTVKPKDETSKPKQVAVVGDLKGEVYFGLGSASPQNTAFIGKAATWLAKNSSANVTLSGHADPSGTPEANMALSQSRAEKVRDVLVAKGVDAARITVEAFGDTQLKYGKTDARNRRVAIDAKGEAKSE
jgi:outer membrane protein OmpA-like peptidoglycan-associated protein